jgi:hypothetical protein
MAGLWVAVEIFSFGTRVTRAGTSITARITSIFFQRSWGTAISIMKAICLYE